MTKQECTKVEYKPSSGMNTVQIEDIRGEGKPNSF